MELLSLIGTITGAIATLAVLCIFGSAGMNSGGMNRILLTGAIYGGFVGSAVGVLVAFSGITALKWLVVPLAAVAPLSLYLLVAFAYIALKETNLSFPGRQLLFATSK